jgi:CheY-like chemotaxis protein
MTRGLVLVVEDEPALREIVALFLSREGLEVECAANGVEALAVLQRARPDLILLDMEMPVMDGWELCRRMSETSPRARPPIVVVTSAYAPAERAAEVRADGWLAKPFGFDDLVSLVRRFIGRQQSLK